MCIYNCPASITRRRSNWLLEQGQQRPLLRPDGGTLLAHWLVTGWNKNANQLRAVENGIVFIWFHSVMCVIKELYIIWCSMHIQLYTHLSWYSFYVYIHTIHSLGVANLNRHQRAINRRLRHFDPFGCELWCVTLVWNHCWFGTGSFHRKIHHERWYLSAKMMIFSWLR